MAKNPLDVSGIYVILHVKSGRAYVGSAVKINRRWSHHLHLLHKRKHYSKHLQNAWTKYGEAAFRFEVIEYVEDKTALLLREQFWIDHYDAANHEIGFNSVTKAGSQIGYRHTPEARMKMSLARKGKGMTPEALEKMRNSLKGRPKSPEHIAKVAAALMGKKASASTRAKLSAVRKGRDLIGPEIRQTDAFKANHLAGIKRRSPDLHLKAWATRREKARIALSISQASLNL